MHCFLKYTLILRNKILTIIYNSTKFVCRQNSFQQVLTFVKQYRRVAQCYDYCVCYGAQRFSQTPLRRVYRETVEVILYKQTQTTLSEERKLKHVKVHTLRYFLSFILFYFTTVKLYFILWGFHTIIFDVRDKYLFQVTECLGQELFSHPLFTFHHHTLSFYQISYNSVRNIVFYRNPY